MRKSLYRWLICPWLLLSSMLFAQSPSVAGLWMGSLHQDGSLAPFAEYRLRVELKQEGVKVTGTSYIYVATNQDLYAKMTLEGRYEKGTLTYHEIEIVGGKQGEDWGWCLKRVQATMKQVGQYLRLDGDWQGYRDDFPCNPGTLRLEKLNPQPKEPVVVAKEPAKEPEKVVPEPVKTPVADVKGEFGTVLGRKITHRKEVPVYQQKLKVYVWDGDKVDGDVISLQYNGQWLLRKYAITKEKKLLEIMVTPGAENQLILYAENQGTYPPNTAALTFYDGKQERNLSLSSDVTTCGALKFVVGK